MPTLVGNAFWLSLVGKRSFLGNDWGGNGRFPPHPSQTTHAKAQRRKAYPSRLCVFASKTNGRFQTKQAATDVVIGDGRFLTQSHFIH
ncbi:MAG: hypothetical protein H6658_03740 [Ardenticatenaceae bacterium]|nr:hypothetical protein [Ardenticatenaceae bacterium]